MNQNAYVPEEPDVAMTEIKEQQRRDLLLHIDEILTTLDAASPAVDQWKAARRHVQLIEGKTHAAQTGAAV